MDETEQANGLKRWRAALVLTLVFPIVAFLIASAVPAKYQHDLDSAFEQELGRTPTSEERASVTIDAACADPEFSANSVCLDVSIAAATRWVAIGSALAGILLLLLIAFCARQSRRDRDALLRLFRPGLYLTLIGATVLVTADALLVLSSVYLGLGVFLHTIFPVVLLAVAIGGLLGVAGMLQALVATTRRAQTHVIGVRRTAAEEPRLHALIAEIAAELGSEAPENVLVGLDPTFFVTEADAGATDGLWRGRNLFLSMPLMRILEPAELRAVIGHELGHFRGRDSAYSERFYPIYRGTGEAIVRLSGAGGQSAAQGLALLPAMVLLSLFYDGFATAERAISRDRELAADVAGASAASPRDLGTALLKISAFTAAWPRALDTVVGAARSAAPVTNASDLFVDFARAAASPDALRDVDAHTIPHPTDSHPPVSLRLDAFGLSAADLANAALALAPQPAADEVLLNREADERALTTWANERIRSIPAEPQPAAVEPG
jgi:Zn-dependent protease with chaperone function